MVEPCEIWIKTFVIAFILIAGGTFLVYTIMVFKGIFTKSGNILFDHQERKIEILEDEIRKYKNNI